MITRDVLDKLAKKLMFKMNDEEYQTLESEFDIILKQMEFIDKIDGIGNVNPMTFPFDLELDDNDLREDIYNNDIDFNDMVINVKDYDDNRVKVPKVVE
ncbi:MAG: Asp-tRNA(Asn)/Glu-tRNA(Gln) amidotransferase subunit GatC [Bacilli bacterium]